MSESLEKKEKLENLKEIIVKNTNYCFILLFFLCNFRF
jgi:hypothetical protein